MDPTYRLRQHNGEITGGARYTRAFRPWVHAAVVRGFPGSRDALQFEWHWKNPRRSTRLRDVVRGQSVNGPRGRLWVLNAMMNVEPWASMALVVEQHNHQLAVRPPPPTVATMRATVERLRPLLAAGGANLQADLGPLTASWARALRIYDAADEQTRAGMRGEFLRRYQEARATQRDSRLPLRYAVARAQSFDEAVGG